MKILLGISGGVDSACAAKKLLDEGHEVEGATLLMHEHTETKEAERVARELGIKLHIIDAKDTFEEIVKSNLVSEYISARTPNPCLPQKQRP